MKKVLPWLRMALPFLQMGETILESLDENDTGPDDDAAHFLHYVVLGLAAIVTGKPIPKVPESLK